ncbi:unnamed protein product [Ilex paraguariensis]|uniref:Transmembrane protein n=1 Tax=Ilex paraguariensis TaxID=185542 RepID=A0ABC8T8Y9_9AQUA
MASTVVLHNIFFSVSACSAKCYRNRNLPLNSSLIFSSKSLLRLKKQSLLSTIPTHKLKRRKTHAAPVVFAVQSNFLKGNFNVKCCEIVLQTVWNVGKDGIEAGTNLVPDPIPRPIARISVTIAAVTLALFVLKSFLSTAFFVSAVMGLIYFTFIAINKDEGPRGGGGTSTTSTEDSLEEARRIMEKYK